EKGRTRSGVHHPPIHGSQARRIGPIPSRDTPLIDFRNAVKGAVVESAILSLMRHGGYSAVPSSVENLFPILPALDHARYSALDLASQIRLLPDLLILPDQGEAQLV